MGSLAPSGAESSIWCAGGSSVAEFALSGVAAGTDASTIGGVTRAGLAASLVVPWAAADAVVEADVVVPAAAREAVGNFCPSVKAGTALEETG